MSFIVEGEICPGLIQRNSDKALRDGQSYTPNFNYNPDRDFLPPIRDLATRIEDVPGNLTDPGRWQRLHLFGPGWGDETAVGMLLGPKEVNQKLQARGIEGKILTMGRLVADHRDRGYRLTTKARARAWGDPTPEGLSLENGERFLHAVDYEIILETPNGTLTTNVNITVHTDPKLINESEKLDIAIGINNAEFREMLAALLIEPDWLTMPAANRRHLETLGWHEDLWTRGVAPPTWSKSWDELSDSERKAAEGLGIRYDVENPDKNEWPPSLTELGIVS
jgi:hypothetical protein